MSLIPITANTIGVTITTKASILVNDSFI
jgi:hypothetical protein